MAFGFRVYSSGSNVVHTVPMFRAQCAPPAEAGAR